MRVPLEKPGTPLELVQSGVKGMRWGVRKDITIEKGQQFQNISKDRPRSLGGHLYTSHTARDNSYYAGQYAQTLKMFLGADKVYKNTFEATQTIKAPGKQKRIDTFASLYNEDPKRMAKALAETKVNTSVGLLLAKHAKLPVTSHYIKKYSSLGEKEIKSPKTQTLMSQTLTVSSSTRRRYFERLMKEGYNATVDDNDYARGADAPLIIFKGKNTLKRVSAVTLSDPEIENAISTFDRLDKKRR